MPTTRVATSWNRRIGLVLAGLVGLVLAVATILGVYGHVTLTRAYRAPEVAIVRDDTPEGIARGRSIFADRCAMCHLPAGESRAIGRRVPVTGVFGEFYAANITSHPVAGIGRYSDQDLARLFRYGINREGRLSPLMSLRTSGFADEDLAAVIGFLRSGLPEVAPDDRTAGATRFSPIAKVFAPFFLEVDLSRPSSIARPRATLEYGKYLATAVYGCTGSSCHTPSFAGGQRLLGEPDRIYSANITFHETGIASWSQADFVAALRDGVTPASRLLRPPMPRFSIGEGDARAIYQYLETLPKIDRARVGEPGPLVVSTELDRASTDEVVDLLGCERCHGRGAEYEAQWQDLRHRSVEELADWIRDPQAIKPGTGMPNYGAMMTDAVALRIAGWLKEGRPSD